MNFPHQLPHLLARALSCCLLAGALAPPSVVAQNTDPILPPSQIDTKQVEASLGEGESFSEKKLVQEDGSTYEIPPEGKKLLEEFRTLKKELAQKMFTIRELHTRYHNDLDRSDATEKAYRAQRSEVQALMDELYDKAYQTLILAPDEEAIQYLMTMVQHRYEHNIYNRQTMKGATLLIDLGANQLFLFLAAARSSICSGEFKSAKKIYEYLDEEEIKDTVDKRFRFQIDELTANWNAEEELRAEDAKQDLPRVAIETTRGRIVLELFLKQAPSTVANFISLVEEGYYDGLDFYQVLDNMLAITGDESGTGSGNTGRFLKDEHTREDSRAVFRGSLVMAKLPKGKTGDFFPHTASSQFAIFFTPLLGVEKHQTVFGRVIEGLDHFMELRRVDPTKEKKKGEIILPPDRVIKAEIIRRPDKLPESEYINNQNTHVGHNHTNDF